MSDHTPTQSQSQEIPYGYCHCGCGRLAPLAVRTRPARGYVKGEPLRFINGHARVFMTLADAFWAYVTPGKPDECWIWQGTRYTYGYGIVHYRKHNMSANRVSYELHNGPIPDGIQVCHNCPGGDNPACVNPNHLWLGTPMDNMHDKIVKGNQSRGEHHGMAKLTESAVIEIRELAASGIEYVEIARDFGVRGEAIGKIVRRERWAHIP